MTISGSRKYRERFGWWNRPEPAAPSSTTVTPSGSIDWKSQISFEKEIEPSAPDLTPSVEASLDLDRDSSDTQTFDNSMTTQSSRANSIDKEETKSSESRDWSYQCESGKRNYDTSSGGELCCLSVLIVWAALTALCVDAEAFTMIIIGMFFVLFFVLVGFTTVIVENYREQLPLTIAITTAMFSVALLSIFLPIPFLNLAYKYVAAALALPCMVMCWNTDKMHTLITSFIVLPSVLITVFAVHLPDSIRCCILSPPFFFLIYKVTALAWCSNDHVARNDVLVRFLLYVSGGAMIVGSSIAATVTALQLQPVMPAEHLMLFVVGITLTITGGILLNMCLAIESLQKPKTVLRGRKLGLARLKVAVLSGLIFLDIITINYCLKELRVAVIAPILLLACLYIALIYCFDEIRASTPSYVYLLILGFISANLLSIYLGIPFEMTRNTAQFVIMECYLLFIYFMITSLVTNDKLADQATSSMRDNAESSLERAAAAAITAAVAAKTAVDAARVAAAAAERALAVEKNF